MKDLIVVTIILVLAGIVAIPVFLLALPGVLVIIVVALLFHWLDRNYPDNHNDQDRR